MDFRKNDFMCQTDLLNYFFNDMAFTSVKFLANKIQALNKQ